MRCSGEWSSDVCSSDLVDPPWPFGDGGPYQLSAGFDASNLLDWIEVRAGDHKDEGAFEVTAVDVVLKPMCQDGTLVDQCNASLQYCNGQLTLENNCHLCGYTCPAGYSCTISGQCQIINTRCMDGRCPNASNE